MARNPHQDHIISWVAEIPSGPVHNRRPVTCSEYVNLLESIIVDNGLEIELQVARAKCGL